MTNLRPGDPVPRLERTPSEVDLFRFSAMTWNAHRIHYDRPWAEHEGHPGVVVQAHLHGAYLAQAAMAAAGPGARLRSITWSNRRVVTAGTTVRVTGTVESITDALATMQLEERVGDDLCVTGTAVVEVRA